MNKDLRLLLSGQFSGHGVKKLFKREFSEEECQRRSEKNRKWWNKHKGDNAYYERCKSISISIKKHFKENGAVRTGAVLTDETKLKISKANKGNKIYGKNGRARAVKTPLGKFDSLKRAAEAHGLFSEEGGGYIRKRIKQRVPGYDWLNTGECL